MRLILSLKSVKTISQKEFSTKYNNAMNSYIYNLFNNSQKLSKLHDKKYFKGFCFGNIYPVKNKIIEEGTNYSLIISSSVPQIIEAIFFSIKSGSLINLGEGSFKVLDSKIIDWKLKIEDTLETTSFISLTYHINDKIKPMLYRDNKDLFIKQLSKNLIKKYNYLTQNNIDEKYNLFKNVSISLHKERTYSTPLHFENKTFNAIGEKLCFKLGNISEQQMKILQCCFDAGFGERNSYGMGFMIRK